MRTFILSIALAACLAGCRRTDERDFEISIPGMTAADTNAVYAALAQFGGVKTVSVPGPGGTRVKAKAVSFDLESGKVRVVYDSMQVARKNLEFALAEKGFAANGVTPESVGTLPAK